MSGGGEGAARRDAATTLRGARPGDADAMAALVNGYAARGLMLPKTPAELCRAIREYVVVVDGDGRVVACGGLRIHTPVLGEIVGLAVDEGWRGRGLGGHVTDRLVEEARALGLARVFAMTLETSFFQRLDFAPVPMAWIPEKFAADCRGCARRAGCREVAVMLDLAPPASGPRRRRRALRVLAHAGAAGPAPRS